MAHTSAPSKEDPPYAVGPGEDEDVALEAANSAVALGIDSICDPSAMFLGRDVELHAPRLRGQTGLQVVPCTGIYTYDHLPTFFVSATPTRSPSSSSHDIEQGIQGTEIKAAFIKCAADEPGVTENVEKVHRAAARASVRTGSADHGPLAARRARPARARSRSSRRRASIPRRSRSRTAATPTTSTTSSACSRPASSSGLDRYGLEMYLPFEQRQATALALLERGYAERIFLSADSCATIDWFPRRADRADARRRDGRRTGTSRSSPSRCCPSCARPG